MLVGAVSVNSLCQQGGPFGLSVNRHFVKIIVLNAIPVIRYLCYTSLVVKYSHRVKTSSLLFLM